MLKSNLKSESTDRLLMPLSRLGIHPNIWSTLALGLALAGAASLAWHSLLAGLAFFVLSGIIDMIDGAVARATKTASARGAFLDGVLDRYVEALLSLGLMIYLGPSEFLGVSMQLWILALLFGSVMTAFVRAYADHRGIVKDPELQKRMGGLLERAERLMLIYLGMVLGLHSTSWLQYVIVLVAVLSNATAVQRVLFALDQGQS
ncbi:MAG TPA: CDP-alcohol phosphatidyltransferase family protein [Methanotrichaceae archaeon]|nr:CDP-alcohol phosphatidyltransferase family protein [Methanotrichaceae archaeon]